MRRSQPFHSAAGHAHSLHGHLYGLVDGGGRHNETGDDDEIGMTIAALETLLLGVERKAEISVAKVLGLGKTRTVDIRHDGRFDKQMLHGDLIPKHVVSRALMETNHGPVLYTIGQSQIGEGRSQHVTKHGYSIATGSESFAQIAGECPCDAIGQDQSTNDPVFVGMRDPGNEPDLAVYALDIDASGENIRDNHRFSQGRFALVGHNNPHSLRSSSSKTNADSPALDAPQALGTIPVRL